LLGYTPPERLDDALTSRVSLTVWNAEQIEQASQAANRTGRTARLHLKVDTGMSRLGVQAGDAPALAQRLVSTPDVILEGLFTHFAKADESDPATTQSQESLFQNVLHSLESSGIQPELVHAANSAASLTRPSAHFDMVRAGIAIYGLHPSEECPLPETFRPALSWKSVLSMVKVLPPGRGLSYGHEYFTQKNERIGTIPVGYADGFRRTPGNQVLVGGQLAPIVGRVCMDQVLVQLDGVPQAREGDPVVLIGEQDGERISAEQVAKTWGTINYEVVCGIGPRVPRIYA
jgi:alanine racemase